jgi:hypothetical protein
VYEPQNQGKPVFSIVVFIHFVDQVTDYPLQVHDTHHSLSYRMVFKSFPKNVSSNTVQLLREGG